MTNSAAFTNVPVMSRKTPSVHVPASRPVVGQSAAAGDRLLVELVARHLQPTVDAHVTVTDLAELPVEKPIDDNERTAAGDATARRRHVDVTECDVDVVCGEAAVDRRLTGMGVRAVDVHRALAESKLTVAGQFTRCGEAFALRCRRRNRAVPPM